MSPLNRHASYSVPPRAGFSLSARARVRVAESVLQLSASDVSRFLGCRHRTGLDLKVALGEITPPNWVDPLMQVLRERGLEHEQHYT